MSATGLTACILAGGKSTRMGHDKACVEFEGHPLWRRQLGALEAAAPDEILISGHENAIYAGSGFRIVIDETPDAGPLAGIASLLDAAAHPLVMVLAVDMPLMTGEYLFSLRRECLAGIGAVPRNGDFFEGLAAVYPKAALGIARGLLRGGDHSMQRFVRECRDAGLVKIVDAGSQGAILFRSVNSPEDLAEATA